MTPKSLYQATHAMASTPLGFDEFENHFDKVAKLLGQKEQDTSLSFQDTPPPLIEPSSWYSEVGWWLHVKWHSHWYGLYAEYYFEAWITETQGENDPRKVVPSLELRWRHGDVRGIERGTNVDMVAKSDRVYATSVFGPGDMCAIGIATDVLGEVTFLASPEGCTYA